MSIAFVINKRATKYKVHAKELKELVKMYKGQFPIYSKKAHLKNLEKLVEKDTDLLMIYGGDGTVSRTITRLLNAGIEIPKIALLPGGDMNALATKLGIPNPFMEYAIKTIEHAKTNQLSSIKEIECINVSCDGRSYYGWVAMFGLARRMTAYYHAMRKAKPSPDQKNFRLLKTILKPIEERIKKFIFRKPKDGFFEKENVHIYVDGTELPKRYFNVGVCGKFLDLIAYPLFPNVKSNEIGYGFATVYPIKLITYLIARAIGIEAFKEDIYTGNAKEIVLIPEKKLRFTLDGERLWARQRLAIKTHKPLKFVAG